MTDGFFDLSIVPHVPFKRDYLSQVSHDSQVSLFVLIAIWSHDLYASFGQLGNQVSAEEPCTTEDCGYMTTLCVSTG